MSGLDSTVTELLPIRDELIELVEDPSVNPVEKNDMLIAAETDEYLGPAVAMHGLLQELANGLHRRAYPEQHKQMMNRQWAHSIVGNLYRQFGNFDPATDLSDQVIDFSHLMHEGRELNRDDHAVFMRDMTSSLLHAAHCEAYMAESYRQHNVGVRGYYIDEINHRVGLFSSFNQKQNFLKPKICAEPINLETAQDAGFTYCVGLVVISLDRQTDPGSGIETKTEPPCGVCRLELSTNPMVTGNTLIISANTDGDTEEHTVREIIATHGCPI